MTYVHQSLDISVSRKIAMPWESLTCCGTHELNLRTHEALFFEGDDADFLYEVVDGVLCSYRVLADGRRQVLSFAYPGDLVGLTPSGLYRFNCEAACKTSVRCIAKCDAMRDAREYPDIGSHLLEHATSALANMEEHQMLLGRKSAAEKLASFLLTLARKATETSQNSVEFHLPMRRADIADYLGLTIETVSRSLTKFRMSGVISLPHASIVAVPDIDRLAHIADGDG
jgi:CRP-like cAMP-binding protein